MSVATVSRRVERLVRRKGGILLDVSLGGEPQANAVTFADLRHSPLDVHWPLADGAVHTAVVRHVLEFLDPAAFFRWFDELHRVLRPGGVAYISGPYGGDDGAGWVSDPTHRTRVVETTFAWLDPTTPLYERHGDTFRPTPKPWRTIVAARVPGSMGTVSYNAILQTLATAKILKEAAHGNGR